MLRYECSYCGGWDDDDGEERIAPLVTMSLRDMGGLKNKTIDGSEYEVRSERKICIKCLIKTFDLVLGKPKE